MITNFFTTSRIAGILLILSLLLLMVGLGLIVKQGKLAGMEAAFRGVSSIKNASGLQIAARYALPALMALLAGFTLVAMLLHQSGDQAMALVALVFLVFGSAFMVIETTFQASVTVYVAPLKTTPDLYEHLRRWINGNLQITSMSFVLTGMLLFSWSAIRTGLLPAWVGWSALGLSIFSFWHYFFVLGAPAVIFVTPLVFGIGLLLRH